MIPRAHIIAWQEHAPWADEGQVEQDLVLSRAIVELFSDPRAQGLLAFRGGTALHKIHLAPASRYSEDIDLVQVAAGPAKPIFDLVRDKLDPWLGTPKTRNKEHGIQLFYQFETEFPPVRTMRVKVEVNTREHFSVLGHSTVPFAVTNPWFTGSATVLTYPIDELLGTKLRAMYQRKKGRDLFDLWEAHRRLEINIPTVIRCFRHYLDRQGLSISRAEFVANLDEKATDEAFLDDVVPLLRSDVDYDQKAALALIREAFLTLL